MDINGVKTYKRNDPQVVHNGNNIFEGVFSFSTILAQKSNFKKLSHFSTTITHLTRIT